MFNNMSDLKIFTENIEQTALQQIYLLLAQPSFQDCKVRIMPDVHAGAGCVIGFTADLGDKVIPNIVGVDIGCGMLVIELGKINLSLEELDKVIRAEVPSGRNVHESRSTRYPLESLLCFRELKDTKRMERSIGTLGGGNHFIEVDVDNEGNKYLVIHSGSRNLGKQVAELYQAIAVDLMQGKGGVFKKQEEMISRFKAEGRRSELQDAIKELHRNYQPKPLKIPKELCYLEGMFRERYLHDMKICQDYALTNRSAISDIIMKHMGLSATNGFQCIHNYIGSDNIVRKGAISARKGERVLIPLNMRDGCILGVGLGSPEWNYSAPHGAGRILSRSAAKAQLCMDEYEESMDGIFTTSVCKGTIDEAPMAYKPTQNIIDNIGDTVEIQKIIKPVYNYKASE